MFAKEANIKDDWNYAKRLTKHKYYVYKAGREMGLPRGQLLKHDWSKYKPSILVPFADWLYSDKGIQGSKDPIVRQRFLAAIKKHESSEAHHLPPEQKSMNTKLESLTDWYSSLRMRAGDPKDYPKFKDWVFMFRKQFKIPENVMNEFYTRIKLHEKTAEVDDRTKRDIAGISLTGSPVQKFNKLVTVYKKPGYFGPLPIALYDDVAMVGIKGVRSVINKFKPASEMEHLASFADGIIKVAILCGFKNELTKTAIPRYLKGDLIKEVIPRLAKIEKHLEADPEYMFSTFSDRMGTLAEKKK